MATSTVNDLDGLLSSLNQLKPPGASKNKIATITQICVNNIQAESTIVQTFYRALKKAPATHKLGALYVIDSVIRQWIDAAKKNGQNLHIEGRGEMGSYPAAVKRVTELMPALFDDIMKGIPEDQKPKLANMITIWERGSTFPAHLIAEFKAKLSGAPLQTAPAPALPASEPALPAVNGSAVSASAQRPSTEKFMAPIPTRPVQTPIGHPPAHLYQQGLLFAPQGASQPSQTQLNGHGQQSAQAPPQPQGPQPLQLPGAELNSIMAALQKGVPPLAPTPTFPPTSQLAALPPGFPAGLPPQLAALFSQQTLGQQATSVQAPVPPMYGFPPTPAPQVPSPSFQQPPLPHFPGYPPQPPPSIPHAFPVAPPPAQRAPAPAVDPLAQLRGLLPDNILNDHQKLIPALQLLQDLQKDGIPPDKWGPVLKAFEEQYQPPAPAYAAQGDHGGIGRGRSRSPERGGRGGRGSPVYGSYDAASRQKDDGRGGNQRGRYRQRSPMRNSPGPGSYAMNGRPMQPKYIGHDSSLPPDNIKVLSRTLFVGGANGTQQEIQDVFERYGRVQTCIANRDKRHAFVKMTTRNHALAAKAGMEEMQTRNDREVMAIARQTKWGVGFGPRECCDYQRGESIIPIHKLTEADLKWLHTAEYGGTGGRSLEGGMVLEEPDIEIGAGVSSKAMSKRVGPENNAPAKRQREDGGGGGGRRHGKKHHGGGGGAGGGDQGYGGYSGVTGGGLPAMEPYAYVARPEPVAVATPPAVPGFGFSFLPQNR
ncbi:hypothetical protein DOTSEDRAFT_50941 [Dothistroma septosporum NZE10]|uniref:CID domain-containing protein n=1 Tax=Dothistroma septosporum (strain NZE10 / CBS 128990) TaxID=675120 RepID=N1PVR1_DOTSN|nr:hypothetical protein DOTSEDRAFT_50941 [Dothistroma septosporum NZE10]